jgi:hypothetical protein
MLEQGKPVGWAVSTALDGPQRSNALLLPWLTALCTRLVLTITRAEAGCVKIRRTNTFTGRVLARAACHASRRIVGEMRLVHSCGTLVCKRQAGNGRQQSYCAP